MVRLSNSSMTIYKECGYKFYLHYKERIRPVTTNSALIFGSALDKAIAHMLTKQDNAYDVFAKEWKTSILNGETIDVENSILIKYSKSDFDSEIVEVTESLDKIMMLRDINGFDSLSETEKLELNRAHWKCLLVKGKLLIEAFKRDIYPNIEKVLGLQVPIEVKNEIGDSIIGFADIVCKYKGYDKPIIFDLKTSGRPYPKDSVKESPQLGLYTYALSNTYEQTNIAGYMVLIKDIKRDRQKHCKNCGNDRSNTRYKSCDKEIDAARCGGEFNENVTLYAATQVLIDTIEDVTQENIIQEAENINESIKCGNFAKNEESCTTKFGRCPYYRLCHENSMDGLIKLDNKEQK